MNKIIIILLVIVALAFYTVAIRTQPKGNPETHQIDLIRKDIIRMDSVNHIKQKQAQDSIRKDINGMRQSIQVINSVNTKLKKQNEKLDIIYNSIHADMPEF